MHDSIYKLKKVVVDDDTGDVKVVEWLSKRLGTIEPEAVFAERLSWMTEDILYAAIFLDGQWTRVFPPASMSPDVSLDGLV